MNDAIRRYGGLFGGVVVAGLVGGKAAGWMIGDRAVAGPLLLLGDARTAAAAIATTVALTIVAIVVARMVNSAVGIFVMGCGLGALAMRCGTVRDLVFGAVPTTRMALETLCWAALIGIAVAAIFALGGHLTDVAPARRRVAACAPASVPRRGSRGFIAARALAEVGAGCGGRGSWCR
ncbi:MAG: hypothetical protein U0575_11495 [Phycisphaerales bacterium]